jgi:hypothetical protein
MNRARSQNLTVVGQSIATLMTPTMAANIRRAGMNGRRYSVEARRVHPPTESPK